MHNQLAARLRKIEGKMRPKQVMTVFEFRSGHEEDDIEKQRQEYLARGGDPDSFVLCVERIEKEIGVADGDFA